METVFTMVQLVQIVFEQGRVYIKDSYQKLLIMQI